MTVRLVLPLVLAVFGILLPIKAGRAAETAEAGPALSADQEQLALAFVKEHHPQLNSLISRLKKRDPAEYGKALGDVFTTCERLQRVRDRDPQRYQVDLNLWKVDSRIRLLAARMAGDERPSLESQLRSLLNERTDLRLQQLELERQRWTTRIDRLDSQVSQLTADRDEAIEKEIARLRKSVRSRTSNVSRKPATQNNSQPADDKPAATPPQKPNSPRD